MNNAPIDLKTFSTNQEYDFLNTLHESQFMHDPDDPNLYNDSPYNNIEFSCKYMDENQYFTNNANM